MGKELTVGLTIVATVIIIGLILRYGASSVPLAAGVESSTQGGLNDLTLKGTGYQYYPPGETPSAG